MTRKMMSPKVLVWAALFTLPAPAWTASVAEQQLVAALGAKPDLQHGANLLSIVPIEAQAPFDLSYIALDQHLRRPAVGFRPIANEALLRYGRA